MLKKKCKNIVIKNTKNVLKIIPHKTFILGPRISRVKGVVYLASSIESR